MKKVVSKPLKRFPHGMLPFDYGDFDLGDYAMYMNVIFTADWGPFKMDQMVDSVAITEDSLRVYDSDGEIVQNVKIKMVPV